MWRAAPQRMLLGQGKGADDGGDRLGEDSGGSATGLLRDREEDAVTLGQLVAGETGLAEEAFERLRRRAGLGAFHFLADRLGRVGQVADDERQAAGGGVGGDRAGRDPGLRQFGGEQGGRDRRAPCPACGRGFPPSGVRGGSRSWFRTLRLGRAPSHHASHGPPPRAGEDLVLPAGGEGDRPKDGGGGSPPVQRPRRRLRRRRRGCQPP